MSAQDGLPAPGLACLTGGHILMKIRDGHRGRQVGSWCLWCGTGAHDPESLTDDGQPIGHWQYGPALEIDEDHPFYRTSEDMPR